MNCWYTMATLRSRTCRVPVTSLPSTSTRPGWWARPARHDAHQARLARLGRAQQYRHGIALQRQAHVIQPGLRPTFLLMPSNASCMKHPLPALRPV